MENKKAWIVSVNMGYGHQRTSYPFKDIAEGGIIQANDYEGITERDKKIWEGSRKFYEAISRFKKVPLIGESIFYLFNQLQKIFKFYPKRDLSKPNFQTRQLFRLMKRGWGKHLIDKLREENKKLPFVSSFFIPAFMAEYFDYPGDIFCIICDADISRSWVPINPQESRIKYFAPNNRVVERLKLYGIREGNIFLTGYPLPLENTGTALEILKEDLRNRLLVLDPQKRYFEKYKTLIEAELGVLPERPTRPLTIIFSIGGAGAQKEIGIQILKSLKKEIKEGKIKLILSAGIKKRIKEYFEREIEKIEQGLISSVEILYQEKIEDYFKDFNERLRKTDILWTKPSELSFYTALGIPMIIAPTIGSQEEFNNRWLLKSGFGLSQEDPNHTHEWLFDWLNEGFLAEVALDSFIEGKKMGVINIKKICLG